MKEPVARGSTTRGNSTIVIGARVLDIVAAFERPVSLKEVAGAASMSSSSAYRYVRSLCDGGMLKQLSSGLYEVGPKVIQLGLQALGRQDPVREAIASMPALTNQTGLVSVACVWNGSGPVVIRCEHGNLFATLKIREGVSVSLLDSASGKLFLAYLPGEATESLLRQELAAPQPRGERKRRLTPAAISRLKKDVRSRQLAWTVGKQSPRHDGIAAPIFDREGRLGLTLSLVGIPGSIELSPEGRTAAALKSCARAITIALGGGDAALQHP